MPSRCADCWTFVDAGEEKDIGLEAALMTGEEIGEYLFVGVAEVRRAVDVVDRSGEKIGTGHFGSLQGGVLKASAYSGWMTGAETGDLAGQIPARRLGEIFLPSAVV